jgi:HNH endonuclease
VNGRLWTEPELRVVRSLYPHTSTRVLAGMLERPLSSVYRCAAGLGLRKTSDYLASPAACRLRRGDNVGKPFRFPKGNVPANKGMRRPGWGPGRMKDTQFRAGQRGSNWVPIGSTRLIDGYRYTKVRDLRCVKGGRGFVPYTVNWKATHILLWEKHRGKLRRGQCVRFKNGDRTDIRLRNLTLISRAENMRRNSVHNLPKALAHVIQLRGALVRQIRRRTA